MIRIASLAVMGASLLAACGQTATPMPASPVAPVATPTAVPTESATPLPTLTLSSLPPLPEAGLVTIAGARFIVDIADDPAERTLGLSGRESLDRDAGMWFVRDAEIVGSFWMREMRFPIDIVWIGADLRVVDVTHSAPVPQPGTPIEQLPRYSPSAPAAFVLEITAGLAEELGIDPGTHVEFSRL